ncbi:MAG: aminoglycoside phosphotransferase family protein [Bacteroidota bacterium]
MELNNILDNFEYHGTVGSIESFGSGLINSTYRVKTLEDDNDDYVLQSINHHIFTNVPELTNNIIRVTDHIKNKLETQYLPEELKRRVLTVVKTKNGLGYYKDDAGTYWRVFTLINNSKTIEVLENSEQAEAAGRAFGNFQGMLSDLPNPELYEILPGFHNTAMRIDNFKERVKEDPFGRFDEVKEDVDFLLKYEDEMKSIIKQGEEGALPSRIVHQDTKLSNILFDENNNELCVIDLDTVMPGYLCYDFGDAVRGGMNNGKEDDENLENVYLNMELFKGFARGYYQSSKDFISKAEINSLAFGAKLLTYEQSVRFLDDYLNGDQYYKTNKDKHNLIRSRAQIAYFKDLERNFSEMDSYVQGLYM